MPDLVPQTVHGRACGACTLCCELPDIDELDKPANTLCRHCARDQGCLAYEARPATCRAFYCAWMTDADMADEWDPAVSHMMVYAQGPQLTVLVDPRHPQVWTQKPYHGQLQRWAAQAAANGGYVIVWVGDEVFKVGA
ncbi:MULTISPECIES: hypothetical protein [Alphaproteobacteria]|uniref:Zinc/iron-chelating domain-containing protein n=2 Tax=Alphaproteobacteria TaxID=28211 RepID=A0A512HKT8_9HYPH|nr:MULTISPECIES: hypothetical protein [Alphaproteobacteria]GEO86057.1 hypothetical protein RNA01_29890 [Ciceribacter naphthalenivorans]GLR22144.1 hypothetical protein GCM10007920_19310 [Ciceribacter naphthalenivorans]GLT05000.1 hypothetical protein GCM10007926_19310 [Sphingomonas psychrolutea]